MGSDCPSFEDSVGLLGWKENRKNVEDSLEERDRVKFRVAWWIANHRDFKTFFLSEIMRGKSCIII